MSRILDSMKTRVEKINAKIKPLQEERDNMLQAIKLLESAQTVTLPAAPSEEAVTTAGVKEPLPTFLNKKQA
jgi:hypothetical protein